MSFRSIVGILAMGTLTLCQTVPLEHLLHLPELDKIIPPAKQSSYTGGFATYYYQDGYAGDCGHVYKDADFVGAIDQKRYGHTSPSELCGRRVKITNTGNEKSVIITIAGSCPTCGNPNSFDLSIAAFQSIAAIEEEKVPIIWSFE